jgi:D-aminoacyl-tRNA deacylase
VRAVVQRVREASIRVGTEQVAHMGPGLLALVGVAREDAPEDAAALAEKLVHLRVMADDAGRMNRSLLETGGTLGVVSQFTLLGDARAGRRPSWQHAAPPEAAEPLLDALVAAARRAGVPVVTGRFRAEMEVALINHGPVTVLLDSQHRF